MKKSNKFHKYSTSLLVFTIISLFIANVVISQLTLVANNKLVKLTSQIELRKTELINEKVILSQKQSTEEIIRKAKKMGLSESRNIYYLNLNETLAKND
jgi:cell division protein FtsL